MIPPMRGESPSEVLKVWLYAAASVLLGAWVSPLIYNAGKALAEVSSVKQTNGPLQWLAGICRAADFPSFFAASLLGSAVLLFLPFLHWLQSRSGLRSRLRNWNGGQRLNDNPVGLRQWAGGFVLVTVVFSGIAAGLILAGGYVWRNPVEPVVRTALRGFSFALGLAVFQEILFRGIALGIFLRAMRPVAAIPLSALLFALVHLLNPPPGLNVPDPDAAGVGFELLRKIAGRLTEPHIILGAFVPLVALGAVLAYARWRTASLWFSVGLHTGWIFINSVLASMIVAAQEPDLLSGPSLQQGLIPLAGILLAGVVTYHLTGTRDATDAPA